LRLFELNLVQELRNRDADGDVESGLDENEPRRPEKSGYHLFALEIRPSIEKKTFGNLSLLRG
jgi:hypothetical protein